MKNNVWVIDLFRKQLMKGGNLATADRLVESLFFKFKRENDNPWTIILQAIQMARPLVHLKTIRVGKSSVSIPAVLPERQQFTMAIRWLVQEASKRRDKRGLVHKLQAELYDAALSHRGGAVQRRIRLHQLAEKNLGNIKSGPLKSAKAKAAPF